MCSGACSDSEPKDEYVARVYDRYLTKDELTEQIPVMSSKEDSLKRAKVFVNSWVKEQVVLEWAEYNLSSDEARFQSKLESYLNDLMIFECEQELVRKNLDTAVTVQEMKTFYEANAKNFVLKDYVVKARILIAPEDTKDIGRVLSSFRTYSEADSLNVFRFVEDNNLFYQDRPDEWIFVNDLLQTVPINFDYFERMVKQKSFFDKVEDGKRHLLYVRDFKVRDAQTPFELERERIRSIILNARKQKILEETRDRLFEKALAADQIEIAS